MMKKRAVWKHRLIIGALGVAMGLVPMATAYGSVVGGGYLGGAPSGPGMTGGMSTGANAAETPGSASLDAADYAATGGTAQGAMTIRTEIPAGAINSMALEVTDPIVKVPDQYTYDYMVHDIRALYARYPGKMTYRSLAQTPDGRDIYEITVGNQRAGTHILINASIHAREYLTSNLVMKQLEYLLAYADQGAFDGKSLRVWLEEVCVHFVPMINPDGVSISQFGLGGVRNGMLRQRVQKAYENDLSAGRTKLPLEQYLVRWKANANGVNLNQNFSVFFDRATGKADDPSAEDYKGAYPASEPESKAMADLIAGRHWKAILNYHSMGNIIYWDTENNPLREHSRDLANNLSALTGYPLRTAGGGGGMKEYAQLGKDPTVSLTLEIGSAAAPVPPSEMEKLWAQNKFVPFYTMKWAAEKGK